MNELIDSATTALPTFGLLPHLSVWDSHASNICFSKSLFSPIQTSTYTCTVSLLSIPLPLTL